MLAFSLAVRIVGSRARAQDIVQEAFLSLWRDAGRYDPTRGLVRTWLMSIVHERGIESVRRLSVHERMQADAATVATSPAGGDLTSGPAYAREAQAVRAALQALPEEERRIIELSYYGGWTQDEIAEMLQVPLDTVKRLARLGLLKLHDALPSELQTPP